MKNTLNKNIKNTTLMNNSTNTFKTQLIASFLFLICFAFSSSMMAQNNTSEVSAAKYQVKKYHSSITTLLKENTAVLSEMKRNNREDYKQLCKKIESLNKDLLGVANENNAQKTTAINNKLNAIKQTYKLK